MFKRKKTIGLTELVRIKGKKKEVLKRALCDTGATRTTVDVRVAAKAGLGPIISSVRIKSSSAPKGYVRRAIAEATIVIKGRKIKTGVGIEDRSGLPYAVVIGRDIIHNNFVVDISKTHESNKIADFKGKKEEKQAAQ
jgi:hypothetical protein